MNNTIISCTDISKCFVTRGKRTEVLSDINFIIKTGEIILIRGKSGAGKTTLLNILAGLERPGSGNVKIAGESIGKLSSAKLAQLRSQNIGFIFQNFNLLPSWTALENVEAALINTKLTRSERIRQAREMLCALDLEERVDYLPSELSLGQQQRVAVARSLVNIPKIVFADEPTGDVDSENAALIINGLVNLVRRRHASLVICTHGHFPEEMTDRLFILDEGKISERPKKA
jgi:putative ABC transport system ATP-binding protein